MGRCRRVNYIMPPPFPPFFGDRFSRMSWWLSYALFLWVYSRRDAKKGWEFGRYPSPLIHVTKVTYSIGGRINLWRRRQRRGRRGRLRLRCIPALGSSSFWFLSCMQRRRLLVRTTTWRFFHKRTKTRGIIGIVKKRYFGYQLARYHDDHDHEEEGDNRK